MEIIMIIIILAAFIILFAKPKPVPRVYENTTVYKSMSMYKGDIGTPPDDTPPSSPMAAQLELPFKEAA